MPKKKASKVNESLNPHKVADWDELNGVGVVVGTRQSISANGFGIKVRAVRIDRVLGVEQVRGQAKALNAAADYAEALGCPIVLME